MSASDANFDMRFASKAKEAELDAFRELDCDGLHNGNKYIINNAFRKHNLEGDSRIPPAPFGRREASAYL